MTHLAEETLNEYLDAALSPSARAAAETHLAVCPLCASRLETLRGLFAELEDLPEVRLARDLLPAVLMALPRRARLPLPIRLVLLLQAPAALAILAWAWPALDNRVSLSGMFIVWEVSFSSAARLPGILALQWSLWTQPLTRLTFPPLLSLHLDPPAFLLGLTLSSACLLWLVGNGLLLRPRPGSQ